MKPLRIILILLGSALILALTSCSPWVVINQGNTSHWIILSSNNSIGQTFVSDYSGLQAVNFLLEPLEQGSGTVSMHLRAGPQASDDIAVVNLPIAEIQSSKAYRFDFKAIKDSNDQYFYTYLVIEGSGSVRVAANQAASYWNGSAYENHQPIDAQLTFSLGYDKLSVFLGIAQQILHWLIIFCAGFLVLVIPGWAILSALWVGWEKLTALEKLPLAIGTSMAFYALFVLITYLVQLQLGKWYGWLPVIAGGIYLIIKNIIWFSKRNRPHKPDQAEPRGHLFSKSTLWIDVSLIIILVLISLTRFWSVRGLEQPMWNDSLHHTVVTQLILDHQGLFTSWLPYAQYQTYSMHFGFPLLAAMLSWVTGVLSGQAVLYMGQILNIFAPLALYPLATRLCHGKRIGGVIAVLTAGLLTPMPAFYINWGRYAQLAGQVILPIAMWMIWEVVDCLHDDQYSKGWTHLPWVKIVITGGLIAGMVLCEFRMIFIIATYIIAMLVAELLKYTHRNIRSWLRVLWSVVLIGFFSLLFFMPWGLRVQGSRLVDYTGIGGATSALSELVTHDYQSWIYIRSYLPIGLIVTSLAGLFWAIIKRDWATASLGLWVIGMSSLYALIVLHIPWVQYVQSFAVLISLYIPAGLLTGYIGGDLAGWVATWKPGKIVVFAVIVLLGIFGAWYLRNIAIPDRYAFVTRPDMRAMQWIKENVSGNARFLIEGTHENWVTNVIGTDAGWWIPLLTGRENTIPPQYAMSNEQPINPEYTQKLVELQAELEQTSPASMEGMRLLCEHGISNVYIGQKYDSPTSNNHPLFTPEELAMSPKFKVIYHRDQVFIYSVENACEQ